ncbi:hypothetical protein AB0G15_05435 [Streptosporangium sp. NPDC023825]|uniref:hypothetical protein n=1 Tax=Streptosporangium sp. NPDC023825 TaxID=3154909 RepID=UPI0034181D72
MLLELWTLLQAVLATWIVWESLQPLAATYLRPELHLVIVAVLAYGALILPAEIRLPLVVAALVAALHMLVTREPRHVQTVRMPRR